MAKHGDSGLGYEIVKAVINGGIFEPITFEKVKSYCEKKGIQASESHMRVILSNATENTHSPTYRKYFERVGRGEYVVLPEYKVQMVGEINNTEDTDEELYQAVKRAMKDDSKKREARLESRSSVYPDNYVVTTKAFKRNADVIAEVLIRAKGYCEKCGKEAPFKRATDGTPYLEVHHIERLADGGEDTVENAQAVCPNCHRELHFG